jgi:hypothetical protein
MNSNKTKAVVLALLLFGLGATVGALGHRYYADTVRPKTAEDFRHKYISDMQNKLKLNQYQVDELQVILDDTKAKVRTVRETYHPEMVKVKGEQTAKVKAILSPDQAKQYELMVAEHEERGKEQDEKDRKDEQHQREIHLKALQGH